MANNLIIFSNSSTNITNLRNNFLSFLSYKGYNVTVSIPDTENKIIFDLKYKLNFKLSIIKYHRSSLSIYKNLIYLINIYKYLKKNNKDLIITFTVKPNILVSFANFFLGIKIINVVTGLGTSFLNKYLIKIIVLFLYRISFYKSNLVIFQNQSDRNYFIKRKIVSYKNSKVILGSGIDTSYYKFFPKNFDKKNINFLYAGRLLRDKGVIELIRSFKIITNQNPHVTLTIAGEIDEGNPSSLSHNFVRKNNSRKINFVGYSYNLRDLINKSDCCILLSYREGLSNFLLESASIGRPIICTNVPGCSEIVDNSNGFLCLPRNIEDTVDKINKFINLNNNIKKQMSLRGRQKVLQFFDNKIVMKQFINEIDKILK